MSAENPNAQEIIEAQAKNKRRDVQDIAHDDTIGVLFTLIHRVGSKSLFKCDVQKQVFFDKGTKDGGNDDLGIPYIKTNAETSLEKGRNTPNKQAMAITGITLSARGVRAVIDSTTFGTLGALATNADFIAFRKGEIEMVDRAGLVLPYEIGGHPGFLENVLDCIRPRAVLKPKFGTKVSGDPIRADRVPCGDATSGLRAAGAPETYNRLKLPIGFLWQPDNSDADSDFAMELEIPKRFLLTVNTPAVGFNTGDAAFCQVDKFMADLTLRVHGRAVAPTSGNAG